MQRAAGARSKIPLCMEIYTDTDTDRHRHRHRHRARSKIPRCVYRQRRRHTDADKDAKEAWPPCTCARECGHALSLGRDRGRERETKRDDYERTLAG
jgi:hypothetical protein